MRRSFPFLIALAFSLAGAAAAQQGAPPAPAAAASPGQGQAQPGAGGDALGGLGSFDTSGASGPVEIDASEGVEWDRDQRIYVARGNAKVTRGDFSVSADTLTAHYRDEAGGKTAIYLVEADGHVVILSKDSRIVGDRAVYDLDKGSAIVTGRDLKATSKQDYVTARDSLEYWTKQNAVVARGNAAAGDKEKEVHADLLTGYFRVDSKGAKKLYQVEATGNVRLLSNGNVARAQKAVYNLDSDIAALDGGVKITRGKNQLNGEHAVYNTKTGKARVTGGGSQVKTLLVPGSDNSAGGVLKP